MNSSLNVVDESLKSIRDKIKSMQSIKIKDQKIKLEELNQQGLKISATLLCVC